MDEQAPQGENRTLIEHFEVEETTKADIQYYFGLPPKVLLQRKHPCGDNETVERDKWTSRFPKETMTSRLIAEKATRLSEENMTDIYFQPLYMTRFSIETAILLVMRARTHIRLLKETNKTVHVHLGTESLGL